MAAEGHGIFESGLRVIIDTPTPDPALANTWMPVVNSRDIDDEAPLGVVLMEQPLVVWRTSDGAIHVAHDQCPHRGAALSIGELRGDQLMCPYHGWQFGADGVCTRQTHLP